MLVSKVSSNNNYSNKSQTNFKGVKEQQMFMDAVGINTLRKSLHDAVVKESSVPVRKCFSNEFIKLKKEFKKSYELLFENSKMFAFKAGDETITISKRVDDTGKTNLFYLEKKSIGDGVEGGKAIEYFYQPKGMVIERNRTSSIWRPSTRTPAVPQVEINGFSEYMGLASRDFEHSSEIARSGLKNVQSVALKTNKQKSK